VELVTALAADPHAALIERDCAEHRVGLQHVRRLPGRTATYLCIHQAGGDLLCAISDMEILAALGPEHLAPVLPEINRADLCALDANLSEATLAYLAEHVAVPIFFDPVSCAKAPRLGPHLGRCFAIKPNRAEAAVLSGRDCDDEAGLRRAADDLLRRGVERVFVSLGPGGVLWADRGGAGVIPAEPTVVVDTTGAGDAMGAAIICGGLDGLSTEACARLGVRAGALACAAPNA
jgi:pseudouridine kinase